MITEDYVSFETAKLLKEKGFDWNCESKRFYPEPDYDQESPDGVYAPTLQMVMKWLRKIHNIYIEVNLSFSDNPQKYPPLYYVYVLDTKSGNSLIEKANRIDGLNPIVNTINEPKSFETYEQACETAIKYCLENLI